MTEKISIVDMFCGGGGESTGLIEAARSYGLDVNLSAINHWEQAIETHSRNYPFAEHLCENVQKIDPHALAASGNTDLLWASPGCQHFSVARGRQPKREDMRSPAWEVVRFAEELMPKRIIIENVPEFRTWGPLDPDGKAIPECRGKTFRAFISALKSLNYAVDWRILCAADYGAPTSRRRLFVQTVRKDCAKKIIWPQPTNTRDGDLILPKWRSAGEIIDWNLPCKMISERKKPLAAATMKRIECGIREFWKESAVPFIARLYGASTAESIDVPLSTISCSGAHHMLIQPFGKNRPMLIQYYGTGHAVSLDVPIPTLTTKDRYALVGTNGNGIELGYRMLQPHELAAATGFPEDYVFTGTKSDVVKQIGNAVPPAFARAMFSAILEGRTRRSKSA